ncbi:VIT domain-containing protein [Xanthomonas sp. NCPPB 2654]|uniref:VIT domain-containing protein n=1 Tax=unclassified Xanthomonas TaxID=2643310 RepID=UPI0021E01C3E|nr:MULTISPECIES: VIT domain-containing protein [unclassified Xanthomonas]MDL5366932.1 VIT domain-containing protein [Xanthomonas sp. NCPPB 2654]UYC22609.1 VIT domain-containing protein [Xanthomonas sp. CFBP 8443]
MPYVARKGLCLLLFSVLLAIAAPAWAQTAPTQHLLAPLLKTDRGERPVELRSATVSAHAAAGLAETTVELVFFNPNARVLEGQLAFPLRDGQQISGFALDIDGQMRDAVPVPKARGRQVFEAIERRGVDPGLVEQTAGNQFQLRLYPIPAHGSRRVRLVYRESLARTAAGWQWRLPLGYAASAQSLRLQLSTQAAAVDAAALPAGLRLLPTPGGYAAAWSGTPTQLPKELVLSLRASNDPRVAVGSHDGQRYFQALVPIADVHGARPLPQRIGLLWDASGSARQRDIPAELALLQRYFAAVGNAQVDLVVLRDRAEAPRRFQVRDGDWSALQATLQGLQPDGASALGDWRPAAEVQEYLLFSDGLGNYGAQALPALAPGQRLYAVESAGAHADAARLAASAEARGGRLIELHGMQGVRQASERLLQRGGELVALQGEGVADLVADSRHADDGYLRIAGRLLADTATLQLEIATASSTRRLRLPLRGASEVPGDLVPGAWARAMLRSLAADPLGNAERRLQLASRFGLVSADTSLLVLENVDDYVRYAIAPPPALREAVARAQAQRQQEQGEQRKQRIDHVAGEFAQRIAWWQRTFPKNAPPQAKPQGEQGDARLQRRDGVSRPAPAMAMAPPPAPAAPMQVAESAALEAVAVSGAVAASDGDATDAYARVGASAPTTISLALQPWQPDSPYARRLRAAAPDALYPLYLSERAAHADSVAFYLDVADVLFERGQRDLALRVLSNLAELQLENRHVLRVLGYRLLQAGRADLAVPVFEQVLRLGEEEPQSFRDLGLAQAAAGDEQAAIEQLYQVVARDWDPRFDGVALIALNELNAIVARAPRPLQTGFVDPRLLRNLPLDLRVVLNWDSDNSDMDLWVTDPNGERCYYAHRSTYQGGQLSQDLTGGYGPEEFSLRRAKPGKYKVEANFFGDRQPLVTGATTLHLQLSTGWGGATQRDQQVTLRLKDKKDTILVGEFEVR